MQDQQLAESFDDRRGRPAARRFTGRGATVAALLALAVGGAVHYAPMQSLGAGEPDPAEEVVEGGAAGAAAGLLEESRPVRSAAALSREQQNVARFLSKRYQVALGQAQQFVEYAYRSSREVKVDPFLILAVISVESAFDPTAQSTRGAQGLMQVLTRVHKDKFTPFGGVTAAFDPLANIRVGAQILKGYLTRDGSVERALKSYVGAALLPHDGGYGEKVLSERERIAAAASGRVDPAELAARAVRAEMEQRAVAARGAARAARQQASLAASGDEGPALPPYGRAQDSLFREPVELDRRDDRAGYGPAALPSGG